MVFEPLGWHIQWWTQVENMRVLAFQQVWQTGLRAIGKICVISFSFSMAITITSEKQYKVNEVVKAETKYSFFHQKLYFICFGNHTFPVCEVLSASNQTDRLYFTWLSPLIYFSFCLPLFLFMTCPKNFEWIKIRINK